MNGISSTSSYFAQLQMQGTQGQQRSGQGGRFNQFDADGNGGIDQAELQTMADKMSGQTGEVFNVEEATATYDANNDGLLDRDETQTMMMEIQSKMGGPQGGRGKGGGGFSQQSLMAYQAEPEKDLASILMEMSTEQDESQEEYSPLDLLA